MKKIIGIVITSLMFCTNVFSASVRWEKTEHDLHYYLNLRYSLRSVDYAVKGLEIAEDDSIVYTLT